MQAILCDCGHQSTPTDFSPGFAQDSQDKTYCFACCAERDRASMIEHGDSKRLPLYLTKQKKFADPKLTHFEAWHVTNWPGTLSFSITGMRKSKHNFGVERVDVWFDGPDGFVWHGVNIGDTQIVHCKRTKQSVQAVSR